MFRESWVICALGSAFFTALAAIFSKTGVTGLNSNLVTLIRTIVILAIIASIVALHDEWQKLDLISGVATGLSWLCYCRLLQLGPVSKVAPIDKLSVALAIVWVSFFSGRS